MKTKRSFYLSLLFTAFCSLINAQDTAPPVMGWNSWNWWGKQDVNEELMKETIDAIVENGLLEAGYEYFVVDGGWRDTVLAPSGELRAHPEKFPSGMKALAGYAHSRGLKFGLHTVPGTHDCGGDRVGGRGHEELHVKQFVDWGVDFIKLDKCRFTLDENPGRVNPDAHWYEGWKMNNNLEKAYRKWDSLLENSGRDVVLSASAYTYIDWMPEYADMARTTGDIRSRIHGGARFTGPRSVMNLAEINNQYADKAGNGYWNDPDMMVTGAQGLTVNEQKVHFALWCIMTSPLITGNDPRNMSPEEKKIITNEYAIGVNQDITEQGRRIMKDRDKEIWAKKLQNGDLAVLVINRSHESSLNTELYFGELGLSGHVAVFDIWNETNLGDLYDHIALNIPPTSGSFFILTER